MKYKIIVDKQSRKNPSNEKKEYIVDIEELRVKGDIYDSLIITKDEDYVMRRLFLSEYNVLSVLDEPIKEDLLDLNIELFEGDNYIYLMDMQGNKFYAEYLVKNDFNDMYVTRNEMNSSINQTAQNIELSVNQKLIGYATTEEMNAKIELTAQGINSEVSKKVGENEVCSVISQSADEILLKGNRVIIDSNNFKLTKEGEITATSGTIGGFSLGTKQFTGNLNGLYNYNEFDLITVVAMIMDWINFDANLQNIYDANNDNHIDASDMLTIRKILLGVNTNNKKISGTFKINSEDPKNCISIMQNGQIAVSLGVEGINTNLVTTKNILCSTYSGNSVNEFTGVTINGEIGEISCIAGGSETTVINANEIRTPKLTQTSLESQKKNIEKVQDNALDIIKNIDIYRYNLKSEEDTDKKHLGFVIGDDYNYSKEVTSTDNQGVDNYSFTSLCCKAIQELAEQNQQLQKRIGVLEKEAKNG